MVELTTICNRSRDLYCKSSLDVNKMELHLLKFLSNFLPDLSSNRIDISLDDLEPIVKPECTIPKNYKSFISNLNCLQFLNVCFQCPTCREWYITDRVFCPACSQSNKDKSTDLNSFRLFHCVVPNCVGNKDVVQQRGQQILARCSHSSKWAEHKRVPILSTDAICAEYIRSGLIEDCAFLSEKELLEIIPIATFWESYCALFSENSQLLYEKLGFLRASQSIKEMHVSDKRTSIEVVNDILPILRSQADYCQAKYESRFIMLFLIV